MSGSISSSLNLTLARMNYIEGNFNALQDISTRLNSIQNPPVENQTPIQSEFKNILDEKINDNKNIEKIVDSLPISEEIEPELINAVNLKSKIDLKAQSIDIDEIVETFSNKYNIDSDFIKAIIKQESNFNPKATSKKGAMGLMQLMPKTAESLGVINAYNPWENVEGGVKYLKRLLDKYGNDQKLALAAYNAGSGAVKKYGGIPPYKETQNYVNTIMNTYAKAKEAKL